MDLNEMDPFLPYPVADGMLLLDNDDEAFFITSNALFYASFGIN